MTTTTGGRGTDRGAAAKRIAKLPWAALLAEVDKYGCAQGGPVLTAAECARWSAMFDGAPDRFRKTIDMTSHGYGQGVYRYFGDPVPAELTAMRAAFYCQLLPLAREWAVRLGDPAPWPDDFADWLATCHAAGQTKPTAILLRYAAGDWNALHRDLYGELVFPLQVVIGLDRPGVDHTGGEFLLVEQRARVQSRGTATVLNQGHALIFATRDRPTPSKRGWSRSQLRHGVSQLRSGIRHTLGLVLHDAG